MAAASADTAWALRFISGKYQGGEFPLKMSRQVTISEERGDPPQLRRLVLVPRSPGSAEFVFAGSLL